MTARFSPPEAAARLRRQVVDSYETPEALAHYGGAVTGGLRVWERAVADRMFGRGQGVRTVLAVGCGAGREVFGLEERGLEVTGVDVAPAMIAAARTEAGRRGSRAEFHVVDGERLPFGAAAFDAVVIWSQVLGNVPLATGRQAFLAEARRVIRPGGAMSLSAHDAALTRPMLAPERIVRADDPEPGDLVIQEPREASVRYFRYFDRDDLTNLCAFAGFAVEALVHTDDLGEAWGNVFVLMARAI